MTQIRPIRMAPAGEAALSVEFPPEISRPVNVAVRELGNLISSQDWPEIVALVPGYRSLLVMFDPCNITHDGLARRLSELETAAGQPEATARRWRIPVVYGGADLSDMARQLQLSEEDILTLHGSVEFSVFMIGFSPGFSYMGELPEQLEIARKARPVAQVPANAVQIGGRQTALSSVSMPSGWYVVGTTPMKVFDQSRPDPFLLASGDVVRFVAVDAREGAEITCHLDAEPEAAYREWCDT